MYIMYQQKGSEKDSSTELAYWKVKLVTGFVVLRILEL